MCCDMLPYDIWCDMCCLFLLNFLTINGGVSSVTNIFRDSILHKKMQFAGKFI